LPGQTEGERAVNAHTDAFTAIPGTPPLRSVSLTLTVSDPGRRYLSRTTTLLLPRDPAADAGPENSLFRPVVVPLFPSPSAVIEPGWAVVRATVRRPGSGSGTGLGGAYLRVRRASQPTEADPPLARGMADERGEALVPVTGVPVTNFDAEDGGPVLSPDIDAVLEAYFDASAGNTPDPDALEARRLLPPSNPNALLKASVNVRLASGKAIVVPVVITT
jgi:hypothetical protein